MVIDIDRFRELNQALGHISVMNYFDRLQEGFQAFARSPTFWGA